MGEPHKHRDDIGPEVHPARPKAFSEAELQSALNSEQFHAATTTEGPLLVLAGAGSGKTRVLVHRIAHIIAEGKAEPWQILAVTFTNKAAQEMRHRLIEMLGDDMARAWIGTFHSMCGRILRRNAEVLGYSQSFTIYDSDDQRRVIRRIMKSLGFDANKNGMTPGAIASEIDKAKNRGETVAAYRQRQDLFTPIKRAAQRIYPLYQKALTNSNAMDFGDMLLLTVELLKHHPNICDRYNRRFKYVLVDEFQDTNKVQYDFLKTICKDRGNLAVVGDDDQSIYRWRGANVRNILDFPRTFDGATVVKLEQNYRSTKNILAAANAVIARNQNRHDKALWTEADDGAPLHVGLLSHSDDEAELVAQLIRARIDRGESADDFALLYRQNAQSRLFELAFMREGVPFVLIGATAFFERREVKDVLAYLRLVANPASQEDFERIVNVPSRKIGDKTVQKLRDAADIGGVAGAEVLDLDDAAFTAVGIKGKTLAQIKALGAILREMRLLAQDAPALEVANALVSRVGYLAWLERSDPTTADDRIANVEELINSIAEHEAMMAAARLPSYEIEADEDEPGFGLAGARTPLQAFLDEASLTAASDRRSEEGAVSMLTLHAAKGLEFPIVFMVGMEERTFPSTRAMESDDPSAIEEERRLCYVGITRAMRELYLTAVRYRLMYGREEVRRPSRFLGDLPDAVVGNIHHPGQMPQYRTEVRGSEIVEYDDPPAPEPSFEEPSYRHEVPRTPASGISRGAAVYHNTFGEGVVEQVDGHGPRARLTIRFPSAGTKLVVAKYVQPVERGWDQT